MRGGEGEGDWMDALVHAIPLGPYLTLAGVHMVVAVDSWVALVRRMLLSVLCWVVEIVECGKQRTGCVCGGGDEGTRKNGRRVATPPWA
jgi:hypothetical protein